MQEKAVEINGLNINYKVAGEGQPVLILHGWGGSSDSWVEVQRILAEKGYKIFVPDFPGFGKSSVPLNPWSVGDYGDFVLNFTKKLNLNNFFLVGHSFGGRVAIKFIARFPEKSERLILCNSAGIKPEKGLKTRVVFYLARIGNAIFTPKHLVRFRDSARNIFYIFLRKKDYAKVNGIMKETIKIVINEDLLPDLSEIKTKTLLVWGEIDRMVPLKYAGVFKKNINNSELLVLPKIGHSPHLEVPEILAEKFLNFFKS